ncbi:MAG: hypothetical protein IIA05_03050 [Proteobacteria bacterium]|nr:hypothetical protein [Pseudomonadota bacterium]
MNNLEWYELAVGIRRRTAIIIGARKIHYFAGVELDASQTKHVDARDWSLEDLPADCRSAIEDLLERIPQIDLKREFGEIFLAAKDIGWIEAMAKQSEWRNLEQAPSFQIGREVNAAEYIKTNRRLEKRYLELLGPLAQRLPGPFEDNADKPMRKILEQEFNMKPRTVNNRLIKMKLRKSVPKNKR